MDGAGCVDYARTAVAICRAVDAGDVEGFARLVEDYDRNSWVGLAEQALYLLRGTLRGLASSTSREAEELYQRELDTLVREEIGGLERNLVAECLRQRFARDPDA